MTIEYPEIPEGYDNWEVSCGPRIHDRGVEDGIEWMVVEAPFHGAYNGYARLPQGHSWQELDLQGDDYEVVDIHGGITFGPEEGGWIGFDTMHAWDVWPNGPAVFVATDSPMDIHWTVDMVIKEAKHLAQQVKKAMP